MRISLVDATSYTRSLNSQLQTLKIDYFKIKRIIKEKKYGPHHPPSQKSYSTGLLRIGTILQSCGCLVQYISLSADTLSQIASNKPDIIAFSAVCPTVDACAMLAQSIKSLLGSHTRIIIGGPHVNVAEILTRQKYPVFDDYITGYDVKAASRIINLDIKPHPTENYLDYSLLPNPFVEYAHNTFRVLGCKNTCAYCQDRLIPYFKRDISSDFSYFSDNLPRGSLIHFFDSCIVGHDPQGFFDMCKYLQELNHGFLLSCEIRAEHISEQVVESLVDAGFVEIRVGVESGSERVLRENHRSFSIQQITNKLRIAKTHSNLYVSIYILSGLLGSSIFDLSSIDLIRDYLESNLVDEVKNGIYVPYPMDNINYSSIGINIENNSWCDYDRQNFPVFNLRTMSSKEIWEDFIQTTAAIIMSWKNANGISDDQVRKSDIYPEYNTLNYIIK